MKLDNQNKLFEKYPKIFKQKDLSPQETAMCWGISCGDGWFGIIDCLCSNIKNHVENVNRKVNYEYEQKKKSIVPIKANYLVCEATQVKSKFGGLRFYVNSNDEYIRGLISMAESMSYKTCEECGNPGEPTSSGWVYTLCGLCKDEMIKIKKKRCDDFKKLLDSKGADDE